MGTEERFRSDDDDDEPLGERCRHGVAAGYYCPRCSREDDDE